MAFGFPQFKSDFLKAVCKALDSRSKAIRHVARTRVEAQFGDDGVECLELHFERLNDTEIYIILLSTNEVWVNLSVPIAGTRKRITVFELSGVKVFSDADALESAIEKTVFLGPRFTRSGEDPNETKGEISTAWDKVRARTADSDHERP
jgi:hypothetical protein